MINEKIESCNTCKYCNNNGCMPWCMYDELFGDVKMGDYIWIGTGIYNNNSRLPDCPINPYLPDDDNWEISANSPDDFTRLTKKEKDRLCEWIDNNFIKVKTPNKKHTSYGLKHIFEKTNGGFYITNGQFKGAMDYCGFTPCNEHKLNWNYCISQKSKALKRR